EIPASAGGVVKSVKVKVGDKVSEGSVLVEVESQDAGQGEAKTDAGGKSAQAAAPGQKPDASPQQAASPSASGQGSGAKAAAPAAAAYAGSVDDECDVLVLGAGPGGYSAAFRAADLGQQVVLVERYDSLGGV